MYRGGADARMKKFPSIVDYLQVRHKKVYELLENLAMENSLKPRRGGAITFLIPDAKYVEAIDKIVHGPTPEDATNIISALTLHAYLPDLASMNKYQADIPNGLGKKLVIKKIEGKTVEVENGTLTLDEDFVPFSHVGGRPRDNMAVWKLKGTINLDTPKATYEFQRETSGKRGAKYGGNMVDAAASQNLESLVLRLKIAKRDFVLSGPEAGTVDGKEPCPFAKACDRLVAAWKKDEVNFREELAAAQCLLSGEPTIDFYMLFCNPLVFRPDRVMRAYNSIPDGSENLCAGAACDLRCKGTVNDGSNALLLTAAGRESYNKALASVVADLLKGNTSVTPARLASLYQAANTRNRLVHPVRTDRTLLDDRDIWPVALSRAFAANSDLHQALDEVCFTIYMDLKTMVKQQSIYGDALDPKRRTFRAQCYDSLFRSLELCHGGWAIKPISMFNAVWLVSSSSLALPDIFRAFAMSCLLRCNHELTVRGAGKRAKSRKVRHGRGEEAESESSSDEEPEEDEKETVRERVSMQQFSEEQASHVAHSERSSVAEAARMLSLLSPKDMEEAYALAKEQH